MSTFTMDVDSYNQLLREHDNLRNDVRNKSAELDTLTTLNKQLKDVAASNKAACIRLESERDAARSDVEELNANNKNQQQQIIRLRDDRDEFKLYAFARAGDPCSIREMATMISDLREQVKRLEASGIVNGKQIAINNVESEKTVSYWRDKSTTLRKERHELHNMVDELQKRIAAIESHAGKYVLEPQLLAQAVQIQQLRKERDELQKRVDNMPTVASVRDHHIRELELQLYYTTVAIESARKENNRLSFRINRLFMPIVKQDALHAAIEQLSVAHRQMLYTQGSRTLCEAIETVLRIFSK